MKNKKYHTIGAGPKSNRKKYVRRCKKYNNQTSTVFGLIWKTKYGMFM